MNDQITKSVMPSTDKTSSAPDQPITSASTTPAASLQGSQQKKKISRKHLWTIVGLGAGALIIFLLGVLVFLPGAYLWLVQGATAPDSYSTHTVVLVDRELSGEGTNPFSDSLTLETTTGFIAPNTWSYSTTVTSGTEQSSEGIDVLIFDTEAYQRPTGTQSYTPFQLQEQEYADTELAINASSFFVPGLLDYAGAARFVWNTGGEPWWYLHYRMPIDVARIEADAPEWFKTELFPFSSEAQLGNQHITFDMDVWVNPFSRRVQHEVWNITKVSTTDPQVQVNLGIELTRDYNFKDPVTIEKPSTS